MEHIGLIKNSIQPATLRPRHSTLGVLNAAFYSRMLDRLRNTEGMYQLYSLALLDEEQPVVPTQAPSYRLAFHLRLENPIGQVAGKQEQAQRILRVIERIYDEREAGETKKQQGSPPKTGPTTLRENNRPPAQGTVTPRQSFERGAATPLPPQTDGNKATKTQAAARQEGSATPSAPGRETATEALSLTAAETRQISTERILQRLTREWLRHTNTEKRSKTLLLPIMLQGGSLQRTVIAQQGDSAPMENGMSAMLQGVSRGDAGTQNQQLPDHGGGVSQVGQFMRLMRRTDSPIRDSIAGRDIPPGMGDSALYYENTENVAHTAYATQQYRKNLSRYSTSVINRVSDVLLAQLRPSVPMRLHNARREGSVQETAPAQVLGINISPPHERAPQQGHAIRSAQKKPEENGLRMQLPSAQPTSVTRQQVEAQQQHPAQQIGFGTQDRQRILWKTLIHALSPQVAQLLTRQERFVGRPRLELPSPAVMETVNPLRLVVGQQTNPSTLRQTGGGQTEGTVKIPQETRPRPQQNPANRETNKSASPSRSPQEAITMPTSSETGENSVLRRNGDGKENSLFTAKQISIQGQQTQALQTLSMNTIRSLQGLRTQVVNSDTAQHKRETVPMQLLGQMFPALQGPVPFHAQTQFNTQMRPGKSQKLETQTHQHLHGEETVGRFRAAARQSTQQPELSSVWVLSDAPAALQHSAVPVDEKRSSAHQDDRLSQGYRNLQSLRDSTQEIAPQDPVSHISPQGQRVGIPDSARALTQRAERAATLTKPWPSRQTAAQRAVTAVSQGVQQTERSSGGQPPGQELSYITPLFQSTEPMQAPPELEHARFTDPAPPPRQGNNPRDTGESDYVKSLPPWAKSFVSDSNKAAQSAAPKTTNRPAPTSRDISSLAGSPQPGKRPGKHIEWTAPGHQKPRVETQLKQRADSQPPPPPATLSNAEVNRLTNRIYDKIMERVSRERRRMGL